METTCLDLMLPVYLRGLVAPEVFAEILLVSVAIYLECAHM